MVSTRRIEEVSKLDAAGPQLIAAIELCLEERDTVPTRTLVAAAHETDLACPPPRQLRFARMTDIMAEAVDVILTPSMERPSMERTRMPAPSAPSQLCLPGAKSGRHSAAERATPRVRPGEVPGRDDRASA